MSQVDQILAAAFAELRSARRLVRTWMFTVVAILIGLAGYLQQVIFHAIGSSVSSTVGAMMAPRFVVASLGSQLVWVLMIALVFLAFDIRARDQRDRMVEVLDARPIGNFSMLLGRLIGLVLVGWFPLVVIMLFTIGLAGLANAADWWIRPGVEPLSMAALVFVDAPATLALWCAIVMFVAIVVRNRLIAALVSLALAGLYIGVFFRTPVYLISSVLGFGDATQLPSDLAPLFLSWPSVLHRLSYVVAALALLAFGAAVYPRPDGARRSRQLIAATAMAALGGLGIASLTVSATADVAQRRAWATAHQAAVDTPRADLETISGSVLIDPGRRLHIDIEAALLAPDAATGALLFSLNPGLVIEELRLDGSPVDFDHQNGLLTIRPSTPMAAAQPFTLALQAGGLPDARFAYLDSAIDPFTMRAIEGGALFLLGILPALFDDNYVALMPGLQWLPTPGANAGQDHPDRGRDFFEVDLEVEAPTGWLVAGPGKRQPVSATDDTARVRFNPGAPVPEVGLFAAEFERIGVDVAGVTLELLVSPAHADNLQFFADAGEELVQRLEDMLDGAERAGIPYPYDGFSMVELPMGVRSWGGGWRLDSVLATPGIMLLPEAGLPLAQFGFAFRNSEQFEAEEGGIAKAKVDALFGSLENDFGGGNPFVGISRNFLSYQTGATGDGAAALDFMLFELTTRLVTDREGYFTAHGVQAQLQSAIGTVMLSAIQGLGGAVMATIRSAATNRPAVWDRALGESLADPDLDTEPAIAVNALVLKATAVYRSILDGLGRERAAALLAELRRRYTGTNFTAADLEALAVELGSDLRPIVGDWLHETALPGFLASSVQAFRLPDADTGQPQYQIIVHIRNDEPAPGVFRVASGASVGGERISRGTGPVPIAANSSLEVGFTMVEKPEDLTLTFHMALNRQPVPLTLPEIDQEAVRDVEAFNGHRPSDWLPPAPDGVIIDDLDPGFRVEYADGAGPTIGGGFAIALGALPAPDMDEGLPQNSPFTAGGGTWSRQPLAGAWGKYRHTLARAGTTTSNATAIFATELASLGRWRLEYHMPATQAGNSQRFDVQNLQIQINTGGTAALRRQGEYDITLRIGDEERSIEFDGSVAESGWNRLGEFDITDPSVAVVVANQAEARNTVIADAVRWTPLAVR